MPVPPPPYQHTASIPLYETLDECLHYLQLVKVGMSWSYGIVHWCIPVSDTDPRVLITVSQDQMVDEKHEVHCCVPRSVNKFAMNNSSVAMFVNKIFTSSHLVSAYATFCANFCFLFMLPFPISFLISCFSSCPHFAPHQRLQLSTWSCLHNTWVHVPSPTCFNLKVDGYIYTQQSWTDSTSWLLPSHYTVRTLNVWLLWYKWH